MKASEILIKAKEVIVDPKNWIQRSYALDKDNNTLYGSDKNSICFCSIGAIQKVLGRNKLNKAENFLREAAGGNMVDYNDNHSHSEVMEVWDKAIELSLQNELNESK
jgi:hypothetical protein